MLDKPLEIYALLVGINAYRSPTITPLDGCLNDIKAMHRLLQRRWQVPDDHVVTLRDEQATAAAIEAQFKQHLIKNARKWHDAGAHPPSPAFLFHFSGHGSQAPDVGGDDEVDKHDETLVAHDSRTPDVFDILDDTVGAWLAELTALTPNVVLVLDCCHSETAMRSLGGGKVRRIEPDLRLAGRNRNPGSAGSPPAAPAARWGRYGPYIAITGCKDDQLSYEVEVEIGEGKAPFGALSYNLTTAFEDASITETATYQVVFDLAAKGVTKNNALQTPVAEGDLARLWFAPP